MGKLKITPQEVLEEIQNHNTTTKQELSEKFDVCKETISRKLRVLRGNGEKIIHDSNGLFYLDEIVDDATLEAFVKYEAWNRASINGNKLCMKPAKQIWKDSKQYLLENMDVKTRRQLKKYHMDQMRLLDYMEIEEELED